MIVRGSVLSDKRVTLESGLPERSAVAAIRAVPNVSHEEPFVRDPASIAAPTLSAVPASGSGSGSISGAGSASASGLTQSTSSVATSAPLAPAPPPLSFEAVVKWLATQDEVMRKRLATLLSGDIEQIQSAAREEGWQEGHDEGRTEAAAESERVLAVLSQINDGAQTALAKDGAELAEQCAEIVAAALARIAGPRLVTQKAALGVVNEILKRVTDERELIVRVSAADLPALQEQKEKLGAAVAGRSLTFMADPRVQLGGAIVESKLGSLDGRLDVQLRALFDTLQAAKSSPKEAS